MQEVTLRRRYRFSAAHRYHRPEWSDEENARRFGRCAFAPGHGHNYALTLWIAGSPDPESGFVHDLGGLDELVRAEILDRVDHRHLNEALPDFAPGRRIPSSENLVLWIRDRLRDRLPSSARLVQIDLDEDDDLGARWTEVSADRT